MNITEYQKLLKTSIKELEENYEKLPKDEQNRLGVVLAIGVANNTETKHGQTKYNIREHIASFGETNNILATIQMMRKHEKYETLKTTYKFLK